MSEPNDIWHFSFPLSHDAKGTKRTTSLHSTQKSQDRDGNVTLVSFAQQIHATMNSTASSYQFVPPHEATVVNIIPLPVATVAAIPDFARRA